MSCWGTSSGVSKFILTYTANQHENQAAWGAKF